MLSFHELFLGPAEGANKDTSILTDTYTLMAVGQDDFEDVKVPDVPVQPAKK